MHLFNHSYLSDDTLEAIANRIEHCFEHSHRVSLFVHVDKVNGQLGVSGLAYKHAPFPFDSYVQFGLDSLVVLTLPKQANHSYPFFSQHVDEVPGIDIGSLYDDILLVLAHELRHIDQYWRGQIRSESDRHWSEVDAERFAISILLKYGSNATIKRAA